MAELGAKASLLCRSIQLPAYPMDTQTVHTQYWPKGSKAAVPGHSADHPGQLGGMLWAYFNIVNPALNTRYILGGNPHWDLGCFKKLEWNSPTHQQHMMAPLPLLHNSGEVDCWGMGQEWEWAVRIYTSRLPGHFWEKWPTSCYNWLLNDIVEYIYIHIVSISHLIIVLVLWLCCLLWSQCHGCALYGLHNSELVIY